MKADSVVELDIKAVDDNGEDIAALCSEARLYELGKGLFPAAFDEELVGCKKGEEKHFEIEVESNPCMLTSILQGKTAKVVFDVTVKAVKKVVLPEITDEWVKENFGFEDVAALRKLMGEQIEAQKGEIIPRIMENNALFELQKRLEGDVPQAMCDAAERDLLQSFFEQLQRQALRSTLTWLPSRLPLTSSRKTSRLRLPTPSSRTWPSTPMLATTTSL